MLHHLKYILKTCSEVLLTIINHRLIQHYHALQLRPTGIFEYLFSFGDLCSYIHAQLRISPAGVLIADILLLYVINL